ncbi:MAG TPA: hypothetical protein VFY79_00700 [Dehalococcoidia bacterium]|nr:hypothetical protein [Dehalococcoidia bacterium]
MRSLVAIALAIAGLVLVTACGGGDDAPAPGPEHATASPVARSTPGYGSRQQTAAADHSSRIPGTFVPAATPPANRAHFPFRYTGPSSFELPFCPGVKWSGAPNGQGPVPEATPAAGGCYASNPPSSGPHYNVQPNADVGNGNQINIPPAPDIYPPDIDIPRSAIPHILEHAGVFVGWNCAADDEACMDIEHQLERIVSDRLDEHDRVVMAHDGDLVPGTIGLSSWTRVLTFAYGSFDADKVTDFIATNSCRVDFEGFCL